MNSTPLFSTVEALLADPAGKLYCSSAALLARFSAQQIKGIIEPLQGQKPSMFGVILEDMAKPSQPHAPADFVAGPVRDLFNMATMFGKSAKTGYDLGKLDRQRKLISTYTLVRPTIALTDQEKALIRGMTVLADDGVLSRAEFDGFLATMTWSEGKATLIAPDSVARDSQEPVTRKLLLEVLKQLVQPHEQFLEVTAKRLAEERFNGRPSGAQINRFLNQGNAWVEVEKPNTSDIFSLTPSPASLVIGFTKDTNQPVYYSSNESLVTIAGPGTGKSQVQVIRNLLTYPGSVFVLDIKGELWESTAGYRSQNFGPVYRFAPTDPTGNSNAYNPFDFVSADPQQASVDCELIAEQLIPANSGANDPYWDNRARDFLWVFALVLALSEPQRPNLTNLMSLLSIPVHFYDGTTDPAYLASPTPVVVARLKALAIQFDVPAFEQAAVAIETGLSGNRAESVFDTARRHLTIFARSSRLRNLMSRSDWSPLDLRNRPGTSVYLCLTGDEIDTYAPIIRIILQQHAIALLKKAPARDSLPITFFLDEFPQLQRMESIQRLLDVGRGMGIRLWLFAQFIGQLREAYDKRADGLINACRVRSFMQPDNEAVELLKPQLGTIEHLFHGEKRPLAEPYELMGSAYGDKIVVTARGHDPLLLGKRYAFQDLGREMTVPPPRVA